MYADIYPKCYQFKLYFRNFLIIIPVSLAAFTHLWNPIGFPYPEFDEGIYMGRGLFFLKYQDFDEPIFTYDHPYFGNIFMATVFKLGSFLDPNLFNISVYGYENSTLNLFIFKVSNGGTRHYRYSFNLQNS